MAPPPIDISKVTGNAPDKVKNVLSDLRFFGYDLDDNGHHKRFGNNVFAGMWLAEVSSTSSDEEPTKNEVKAAFGVVVDESMLNGLTTLHGGCSAFMIDLGTTLALLAYTLIYPKDSPGAHTVSHSMSISFHNPALKGEELKVIGRTVSVGGKTMTARCEIWSVTKKRLVASGMQNKMIPPSVHAKAAKL